MQNHHGIEMSIRNYTFRETDNIVFIYLQHTRFDFPQNLSRAQKLGRESRLGSNTSKLIPRTFAAFNMTAGRNPGRNTSTETWSTLSCDTKCRLCWLLPAIGSHICILAIWNLSFQTERRHFSICNTTKYSILEYLSRLVWGFIRRRPCYSLTVS